MVALPTPAGPRQEIYMIEEEAEKMRKIKQTGRETNS
jgi:hypothetical protein